MNKEAYYFSHDSNARQDEKIIALRMKHGWEGYGLYWAIVEKLREASEYKLQPDYNIMSFDLRVDAKLVKSIIEDFGLFKFSEDKKFFYSGRMIRNMKSKSEKARKAANARWNGPDKKDKDAGAMQTHSKRIANGMQNDATKVKESKEKEIKKIDKEEILSKIRSEFYDSLKPFVSEYSPEMLRAFFNYWSEPNKSRTKIKWQMERTWDLNLRLKRWASNNFKSNSQLPEIVKKKEPAKPEKW